MQQNPAIPKNERVPASESRLTAILFLLLLSIGFKAYSADPIDLPVPYNPLKMAVVTQRYDAQRTGGNFLEHVLNVESVSNPQFQELYSIPVTGQVYAQPLLIPHLVFPDGTQKDVLVVATMANTVEAFQVDDALHSAFSPIPIWKLNLGTPIPSNFMPMNFSSGTWVFGFPSLLGIAPPFALPLPSIPSKPFDIMASGSGLYNINPMIGILSTPVANLRDLFVVACTWSGSKATIEHHLVKIDLITGTVIGNVVIGANTTVPGGAPDNSNLRVAFNSAQQMQRPALLFSNFRYIYGKITYTNALYVAFGSHQDTKPWHGWIFSFDPATLSQTGVWCSTPNAIGGAIWQAGNGIAADALGNIYAMTGNGCKDDDCKLGGADQSYNTNLLDFANMFVQLTADLKLTGSFAPLDESRREDKDIDLGSSGPVLLPNTSILIGIDKECQMFVLDTSTRLGMRQIFTAGEQQDSVSWNGVGFHHNHGDPVLWRNALTGLNVYFWPERDFIRVFKWDDNKAVFDCANDPNRCHSDGKTVIPDQQSTIQSPTCYGCMPGGILSVSSQGDLPGSGVLWASVPLDTGESLAEAPVGGGLNNVVPGVLHAFDAMNISNELWNSQMQPARDGSFMFAKFNPPVVANGRVYLATFGSANGPPQAVPGSINIYGMKQWGKFIAHTYPLPRHAPGGPVEAKVIFHNVGTTLWDRNVVTLHLDSLQGHPPSGLPTDFQLPQDVKPGDEITISITMTAGTNPGDSYSCQWRLSQPGMGTFSEATPVLLVESMF